jgi:hypothetical protein
MGHSTKIGVKKQNEKILRLSEANASTPWVSKTPKTVHQVESQSEYLDRRIKRHHSSSPGTIVEALKSLFKGTKAMMRENTLLRFENRDPDGRMRRSVGAVGRKGPPSRKEGG